MGLSVSYASRLENQHPSGLLSGFGFHDRYGLYSMVCPNPFFRLITVTLLCTQGFLILLYLNHLCKNVLDLLEKINTPGGRKISFTFLGSVLLIPGLITFAPLFTDHLVFFAAILALASGAGVIFERILFFRFEQPDFLLSRGQNPEANFQRAI